MGCTELPILFSSMEIFTLLLRGCLEHWKRASFKLLVVSLFLLAPGCQLQLMRSYSLLNGVRGDSWNFTGVLLSIEFSAEDLN